MNNEFLNEKYIFDFWTKLPMAGKGLDLEVGEYNCLFSVLATF